MTEDEIYSIHTDNDRFPENGGSNSNSVDDGGAGLVKDTRGIVSVQETIGKKETRQVQQIKLLTLLVLLLSMVGVAVGVFKYSSNSETKAFEEQFYDDANKILESVGTNFERALGSLDAFAANIASHARSTNQTWPFVTIPDYAIGAAKIRTGILSFGIFLNPVVTPDQRLQWEQYAFENNGWVNESLRLQEHDKNFYGPILYFTPEMEVFGNNGKIPYNSTRRLLPTWQTYPAIQRYYPAYNWDWPSVLDTSNIDACIANKKAVIGHALMLPDPNNPEEVAEAKALVEFYTDYIREDEEPNAPASDLLYPVIDKLESIESGNSSGKVAAIVATSIYWRKVLENILPHNHRGLDVVFSTACNQTFTYQIDGPSTIYLGRGDLHDTKNDDLVVSSNFLDLRSLSDLASEYYGVPLDGTFCPMKLYVYPTDAMKDAYATNNPVLFAVGSVLIFGLTSIMFLVYNWKVEKRQQIVMNTAEKSNKIVSSLFPEAVRDQLMNDTANNTMTIATDTDYNYSLAETGTSNSLVITKPLAELYPDTTVFFADICGFTAWSSVRDPWQVFTLLETVFGRFDKNANKLIVFKVETIGDCYVAVTGLPDRNKQHAIVMCQFAKLCMNEMSVVTSQLQTTLGPGTQSLNLRIGLNSGPTTAGVLRGQKSRFQLFGDTVNTAARMESTSLPGHIQMSQKTATLLINAGKSRWIIQREDAVVAKGKGVMNTYWLLGKNDDSGLPSTSSSSGVGNDDIASSSTPTLSSSVHDKNGRLLGQETMQTMVVQRKLIEWNVDMFMGLLKNVVLNREVTTFGTNDSNVSTKYNNNNSNIRKVRPLDEVCDVISMPRLDLTKSVDQDGDTYTTDIELQPMVVSQVKDLITSIARMHNDNNPYHNFDHTCHVVLSVTQFFHKIERHDSNRQQQVPQSSKEMREQEQQQRGEKEQFFQFSPLTKLAILFAALIHDVDHPGLSNQQLIEHQDDDECCAQRLLTMYGTKSIMEQNSFDIGWNLLLQPIFQELRDCIFGSENNKDENNENNENDGNCIQHQDHFCQVVRNAVLATDITDPELNAKREHRWNQSFGAMVTTATNDDEHSTRTYNRKMTIALEYVMIASVMIHTMQHWDIYEKWNRCMFEEMYRICNNASSSSINNNDAIEGEEVCNEQQKQKVIQPWASDWYNDQLNLFDQYVIPLTRKLKVIMMLFCGDDHNDDNEWYDCAMNNRLEWNKKGHELTTTVLTQN